MLLLGEFRHGIDEKGRVTLPSRMRGSLGEEFVHKLAPHRRSFWLYPLETWERLAGRFTPEDLLDLNQLKLIEDFTDGAMTASLDKGNRLLLPQNIRDQLGMESEVVIKGRLHVVEIWAAETWEKQTPREAEDAARATSEFFSRFRKLEEAK